MLQGPLLISFHGFVITASPQIKVKDWLAGTNPRKDYEKTQKPFSFLSVFILFSFISSLVDSPGVTCHAKGCHWRIPKKR